MGLLAPDSIRTYFKRYNHSLWESGPQIWPQPQQPGNLSGQSRQRLPCWQHRSSRHTCPCHPCKAPLHGHLIKTRQTPNKAMVLPHQANGMFQKVTTILWSPIATMSLIPRWLREHYCTEKGKDSDPNHMSHTSSSVSSNLKWCQYIVNYTSLTWHVTTAMTTEFGNVIIHCWIRTL